MGGSKRAAALLYYKKARFNMADESTNTIRVIVCRPDERAEIVEIEDKLEAIHPIFFVCYQITAGLLLSGVIIKAFSRQRLLTARL